MQTTKSINVINEIASTPDEVAIEQVLSGNTDAFEIIMRRYNQRLYRVAHSILNDSETAQDAMQQAYISAYFKLNTYSPSPTGSFGAWLTRITINEALMIKRQPDNRIADRKQNLDDEKIPARSTEPAKLHANKELADLIESALDELPEEYRIVFILRAIQDLSTRETAESLDINETTVKTRLHRARNLMKKTLNQHIEQAGMHVHEFAGQRCDHMVRTVLDELHALPTYKKDTVSLH